MKIDITEDLLNYIKEDNNFYFFRPSQLFLKRSPLFIWIEDQDGYFISLGSKTEEYIKEQLDFYPLL